MASISRDEWLAELERLRDYGPVSANGYMTAGEIAEATSRSVEFVRKHLAKLGKSGELEVSRRRTLAISGRMTQVPVYRIKRKKGNAS